MSAAPGNNVIAHKPKTLITHATSQAAHFLGYQIKAQHADTKITRNRRAVNGAIGLFVPRAVIRDRCAGYMSKGKPALRGPLLHDDDFTIVAKYGSEYRGFVQYYLLAQDVFRLELLRWVMETSMLKTLAGKHKSTVTKMARSYKATIDTPDGRRFCFQVTLRRDEGRKPLVARFGKGPQEKDPNHGHLVGGLLHSTGRGWKRSSRHRASPSPNHPRSPIAGSQCQPSRSSIERI